MACISAQAEPALPAVTSGTLQLWLEADSGVITNTSGQVSQWQDQSGNANHASQTNAQNQPLLVYPAGLGGRAALRFNGIDDKVHGQYLHGPGQVNLPNALTAFAVYNAFNDTNSSSVAWLIGIPGIYGASRDFSIYEQELDFGTWTYDYQARWEVPTNTYRICTDRMDTNLSIAQIYDTSINSETNISLPITRPVEPVAAGYYIGGINPSLPFVSPDDWDGDIAEVIIYRGYLSEADRLAVLNYLQQKYYSSGTGQDTAPFTSSLVAYYPFNGNANDATGNGNNGQIIGPVALTTDRFGNANSAYHFDGSGSDSAIEVTNEFFNIGQPGYTISGWFSSPFRSFTTLFPRRAFLWLSMMARLWTRNSP